MVGVSIVALVAVGVGASVLLGTPCDDLLQAAELSAEFVGTDRAPSPPDLPGEFLGAVLTDVPVSAEPAEFGFFLVGPGAFTVVRPGFRTVSARLDRVGLEVVPTTPTLTLVGDDGTVAVVDGELELARCGAVDAGSRVLWVDRGFALTTDGGGVALTQLRGGRQWRTPTDDVPVWGWASPAGALVGTTDEVLVLDEETGEPTERIALAGSEVADASTGGLAVVAPAGALDVEVVPGGTADGVTQAPELRSGPGAAPRGAAPQVAGPPLPVPQDGAQVTSSAAGNVAVTIVDEVTGGSVVHLFGPTSE